ncbi:tumor necrosis factor receptor superfamily member 11A [Ornithorhynchus anatinus]|uniref:tumor necrosis factor receptor superfamily member 11A n=1 Tax=Ornithorhynchus anatinus TaxID=9258 RepID=UPI0010A8D7B9|nr:tumor necrosis factor receptor superfamily member 11A [Ornithorhynchus anatinus]
MRVEVERKLRKKEEEKGSGEGGSRKAKDKGTVSFERLSERDRSLLLLLLSPLLLVALLPPRSSAITPPCSSERHYEQSGRCCNKCEPGTFMTAKCTAASESVCSPCNPDEYLDTWNEEDKCLLQRVCDAGKALVAVHPGNSTSQRQCACTQGYHWSDDCDCCRRNRDCGPGFGARHPLLPNRDTACEPCPPGYYSNSFSATDKCEPWTNCTILGQEEIDPGTNKSDVVCRISFVPTKFWNESSEVTRGLIIPFLFVSVALIGLIFLGIYYRKEGKVLTADLRHWFHVTCTRLKGNKQDSSSDSFISTRVALAGHRQPFEGVLLLTVGEKVCPEGAGCPEGLVLGGPGATEPEGGPFLQIPMEDEYLDRPAPSPRGLLALSCLDGTSGSPFPEPLEIGENDSLSLCFTGTESPGEEGTCGCPEWAACTPVSLEKSPQKSGPDAAPRFPEEAERSGPDDWWPPSSRAKGCMGCGTGPGEGPESPAPYTTPQESGPLPPCACGLGFPYDGAESQDPASGRGDAQDHSGAGGSSGTSGTPTGSPTDLPSAPGNVTGNSNSTFISHGKVMNFKGDIIVVYVSQNSQEGPAGTGPTEETVVGSPVQEETLNRCDTFAGNAPLFQEKCADAHPGTPEEDVGQKSRPEGERSPRPPLPAETWGGTDRAATQPVQEEGKAAHCWPTAWHP